MGDGVSRGNSMAASCQVWLALGLRLALGPSMFIFMLMPMSMPLILADHDVCNDKTVVLVLMLMYM